MNLHLSRVTLASAAASFILAGCASTAMHENELREPGANEGIVIGSLLVRGGRDLLGRTEWGLGIARVDQNALTEVLGGGSGYTIRAHQGKDEVVFAVAMPSGQYRIRELFQGGFSNFRAITNLVFEVQPGKVSYIGRLRVEFPEETINMFTQVRIRVEDARDANIAAAQAKYGRQFQDVNTQLAVFGSGATSTLPGKSTADPKLQNDTVLMVMALDGAAGKDCKQRRIVNREIISADASGATENWIVDRCGSLVRYRVSFTPSPKGGTNLNVAPGEVVK
jgi:hypothetical protein